MKYIKHIILTAFVMVMTANAWAQNSETLEHCTSDPNSWCFQMPVGNYALWTTWKQDALLDWKVGAETVTVESNPLVAYLRFPFVGATLTAAYNNILGEVSYSIAHRTGTNSGNTVSTDGVVTINGVGIDTVKAVFAGNDTLMPDSAMYIIDTRAPYTLTLNTNDPAMGNLTLTDVAEAYEAFKTDVFNQTTYEGTFVTVAGSVVTKDWGLQISTENSITISSQKTITKVDLNAKSGYTHYLYLTTTKGTIQWSIHSSSGSITDVNAKSLTIRMENTTATMDINYITVYYKPDSVAPYMDGTTVVADKYWVVPGKNVTVKAIPAAGYQLLKWEDNSTDLDRTVTVTDDTTALATFGLPNPGLTPGGELTTSGTRFLDEYGDIVGTPRLTETGEIIDNGNSALPVHLIGKFSVSATQKVYFSPANLRYTRTSTSVDWSTGVWGFMKHQYSIEETAANPYCTENYGDKTAVGLFGWGTWGEGKTPNITSTSNANYTWSTDFQGTLGGYSDWHTLTKDEWTYLLTTRATGVTVNSTNNARYTLATINTGTSMVKGMIIFPDGFTGNNTDGVTWGTINAASNYTTTCTTAGWNALESANCLFLPATGWRAKNMDNGDGTRVEGINTWSYYWTKELYSTSDGYMLGFDGQNVKPSDHAERRFGYSVRLVRNAD